MFCSVVPNPGLLADRPETSRQRPKAFFRRRSRQRPVMSPGQGTFPSRITPRILRSHFLRNPIFYPRFFTAFPHGGGIGKRWRGKADQPVNRWPGTDHPPVAPLSPTQAGTEGHHAALMGRWTVASSREDASAQGKNEPASKAGSLGMDAERTVEPFGGDECLELLTSARQNGDVAGHI